MGLDHFFNLAENSHRLDVWGDPSWDALQVYWVAQPVGKQETPS